jgi:serine protease
MKNLYLIMVLLLGFWGVNAQSNHYYYYKGEKVPLTLDKNHLNISTTVNFNAQAATRLGFTDVKLQHDDAGLQPQLFGSVKFTSTPSDREFYDKIKALRETDNVKHVALYFSRGKDATPIGLSNYFYIKLRKAGDLALLQKIAREQNVHIVEQVSGMPEWYILSVNPKAEKTSLDAANAMYETGRFADVDPAFVFNFRSNCTNDTDFGSLWGLDNPGNPSADINACAAWGITEGAGINVAVLDQGIDLSHNDLSANIPGVGFNSEQCMVPSSFVGDAHGTHVAGTILAVKNNSLQVVGVAPQSDLIPVSNGLWVTPTISAELACGMSWAWMNGADVINNSWGDQGGAFYGNLQSAILENAITNALTLGRGGQGTLVVFAAGNYGGGGPIMDYPGTFHPDIVTAGAISSTGFRAGFSGHGSLLDVVAPGDGILSTMPYNGTGSMSGTSMAAPHVTGTIALILSVNPCLSGADVRTILESTAQKIGGYSYATTTGRPNGTWNIEMGYGLIDAYAAVLAAQSFGTGLDLHIKDSTGDIAAEPNTITPYFFDSQDIWVRVFADNGLVHQNPDYSPGGNPNTVYVRVRNESCVPNTGTEQLKVYWSKAATSLQWDMHWNGTTFTTGQVKGDLIGTVTIPVIPPGGSVILSVPWVVPNPAIYAPINLEPWHFCLLARIEAAGDPMTFTEITDLNTNVKNNNNIAWKNCTVVNSIANDAPQPPVGGVVAIENITDEPKMYLLEFIKPEQEEGHAIFEDAFVRVHMDDAMMEAWEAAGGEITGMEQQEGNVHMVMEDNATILMRFEPQTTATMNLTFQFNPDQQSDKQQYLYHVVLRDAESYEVIGGENYLVNKRTGKEEEQPDEKCYLNYVSPNPANDNIVVGYHVEAGSAQILIVGVYGDGEGMEEYFDIDPAAGEIDIHVGGYPAGYYSVIILCDGEMVDSQTLIKE